MIIDGGRVGLLLYRCHIATHFFDIIFNCYKLYNERSVTVVEMIAQESFAQSIDRTIEISHNSILIHSRYSSEFNSKKWKKTKIGRYSEDHFFAFFEIGFELNWVFAIQSYCKRNYFESNFEPILCAYPVVLRPDFERNFCIFCYGYTISELNFCICPVRMSGPRSQFFLQKILINFSSFFEDFIKRALRQDRNVTNSCSNRNWTAWFW